MHHARDTSAWRRRALIPVFGLTAVLVLTACPDVAPPLSVTGTGDIEGLVFFDASEDGLFDPADGDYAIGGVDVAVRNRGTESTFGTAQSGTDGRFGIPDMPMGTHDLFIDTLSVPAGVNICQNPLRVTVFDDATTFADVNGRPGCLITIVEAKEANLGDFVIVEGLVTSFPGQIEASFTYIQDDTGGLFLFGSALNGLGIQVGDQIEVGGNTAIFSGQFELTNLTFRRLVVGVATPVPVIVTTAEIAASGADPFDDLQNRFVRIEKARLLEAFAASGNEQNSTIDDGSGAVTIRVDDGVVDRTMIDANFTVNACYDINGFAANFNGSGQIFPRSLGDIEEVPCS